MMFKILAFMEEKGCHCQFDDQHQRCKTCKEPQDEQQAAKYLSKEHEDEGPFMPDVEWIEEDGLLVAEMHELGKPVVDANDQAEGQAQ